MILLCPTDPTVGQSERRARRFVAVDGAARRPRLSVVFFRLSFLCGALFRPPRVLSCRAGRKGSPPPRGDIPPARLRLAAYTSRPFAIFKRPPARFAVRGGTFPARAQQYKSCFGLTPLCAAMCRRAVIFYVKTAFFAPKMPLYGCRTEKNGVFLNFSQNIYKNV